LLLSRTCSALLFSDFVGEKEKMKNMTFNDKGSYTGSFLEVFLGLSPLIFFILS
jgi:hypothetical protein